MEKEKLICLKCSHCWKQRGKKKPKYCPMCKNPNWNKDKMYFDRLLIGK